MRVNNLSYCHVTGKIQHPSPQDAHVARKHLLRKMKRSNTIGHLHVFKCPHCKAFHTGHLQ